MKADYAVYIDESGDLGIGRGTDFFVITAIVIKSDEELKMLKTLKEIKHKINVNRIHMRELPFKKQSFAVREINRHDFTYMNVVIDTNKLTSKKNNLTYNFACRILLERVSWYLRDIDSVGNIVLSARGTNRDNELISYIKSLSFERFLDVTAKPDGSWELLAVADVCATSTFYAYQINELGFSTPCFSRALYKHLYRYNGEILNYGIKYYDQNMSPGSKINQGLAPCQK